MEQRDGLLHVGIVVKSNTCVAYVYLSSHQVEFMMFAKLFCDETQMESLSNLHKQASIHGTKSGAASAYHFRPPKVCPPTVGGHRLGGLFLIQKRPPFWGRLLGGSNRGSVSWSQKIITSFLNGC